MKLTLLAAAVAATLATTGCGKSNSSAKVVAPGDVIAVVNGQPISKAAFDVLAEEVNERRGENKIPDDKILEELIKRELLSQDLMASGGTKDPKLAARIENAERMMLSQAAAEAFVETVVVTDEEAKKEYDQEVGSMQRTEYRARHILVDSEAEAKDLIARLSKGEKFEALAKKASKDPGSKDKGGELGWFSPQQMVEPFAKAVMALGNGETTQTPVQSQFGWHVITREESRDQPPAPFDTVKDQLKGMLQTKKLQDKIGELMSKAKIERKVPPAAKATETPKPAAEGAPAAPVAPPSAPATQP
jgi:peptidyl-prolyl cis-trans isomerase C